MGIGAVLEGVHSPSGSACSCAARAGAFPQELRWHKPRSADVQRVAKPMENFLTTSSSRTSATAFTAAWLLVPLCAVACATTPQASTTTFDNSALYAPTYSKASTAGPEQGASTAAAPGAQAACLSGPSSDRAVEVACILRALGLHQFFADAGVRELMLLQLESRVDGARPATLEAVRSLIQRRLDPNALQAAFEAELQTRLADTDLIAVRAFLATPLGQRYGAVGVEEGDEAAVRQWIQSADPTPEREQLFAELGAAARLSEVVEIILTVGNRLWAEALAEARGKPFDEAHFAAGQAEFLPMVNAQSMLTLRYDMRDFSEEELRAVVAHERSASAQAWTDAMLAALRSTLQRAHDSDVRAALVAAMRESSERSAEALLD